MQTESYIQVEYRRYHYNTGNADNGYYNFRRKFANTSQGREDATAFVRDIERAIGIAKAYNSHIKVSEEDDKWYESIEDQPFGHDSGYYVSVQVFEIQKTIKSIVL